MEICCPPACVAPLFLTDFVKQCVPWLILSDCFAALARRDSCRDGAWIEAARKVFLGVSAAFLFCPDPRNRCPGRAQQCRGMWQHLLPTALCWWHGPTSHRDGPWFTQHTEAFWAFLAAVMGQTSCLCLRGGFPEGFWLRR